MKVKLKIYFRKKIWRGLRAYIPLVNAHVSPTAKLMHKVKIPSSTKFTGCH